jgi:capping protein (actin filament) muscle Z-line, beta
MPPQNIVENLAGLLDIVPDLTEDLLSAVDQPLKVRPEAERRAHLLPTEACA